jgi:hypothetical protein
MVGRPKNQTTKQLTRRVSPAGSPNADFRQGNFFRKVEHVVAAIESGFERAHLIKPPQPVIFISDRLHKKPSM